MIKNNLLFLSMIMLIAIGICMCLTSCKCEFKPIETPQSSKIFHIDGCGIYYVEITHDNHEYLICNPGGIIHKVNCKFCKGKCHESNNSN